MVDLTITPLHNVTFPDTDGGQWLLQLFPVGTGESTNVRGVLYRQKKASSGELFWILVPDEVPGLIGDGAAVHQAAVNYTHSVLDREYVQKTGGTN